MSEHFNGLSPEHAELLSVLSEESSEVVQAVGKIMRHGIASCYDNGATNRDQLQKECGDVLALIELLHRYGVIDWSTVEGKAVDKLNRIQPYLHHARADYYPIPWNNRFPGNALPK